MKTIRSGGVVHSIAECDDCGKSWTSKNSQAVAVKHHYKTGHTVRVEVGLYFKYKKGD